MLVEAAQDGVGFDAHGIAEAPVWQDRGGAVGEIGEDENREGDEVDGVFVPRGDQGIEGGVLGCKEVVAADDDLWLAGCAAGEGNQGGVFGGAGWRRGCPGFSCRGPDGGGRTKAGDPQKPCC